MSKRYRYAAVKGTAGSLFTREQLAYDEVDNTTEFAQHILDFVHDKISEQDYAQLKKMLQGDAAEEESDAPIKGAQDDPPDLPGNPRTGGKMAGDRFPSGLRRRLDAAPATTSARGGFDTRFPSAAKIGRDDMIGTR
jgi:hypothetical protein